MLTAPIGRSVYAEKENSTRAANVETEPPAKGLILRCCIIYQSEKIDDAKFLLSIFEVETLRVLIFLTFRGFKIVSFSYY